MFLSSYYIMYDWPICVVIYMVFHNRADFMEANCFLARIKRYILYTLATEKYQSVYAMYLTAY